MPSASPPPKKAVTLSTVAEMGSPLHLTTNGPLLGGDAPPRPPPAAPPGAAPPDPAIPSGAVGAAAEGSLGDGAEPIYRQATTSTGAGCMAAHDAERYLEALK